MLFWLFHSSCLYSASDRAVEMAEEVIDAMHKPAGIDLREMRNPGM
jgi:hypothetical protein